MVTCPTCGAENSDERAYCVNCGVVMPVEPSWRCRSCGAINSMLNAACQDCGDLHEPLPQMIETAVAEGDYGNGNGHRDEPDGATQPGATAPTADEPALALSNDHDDGVAPDWLADLESNYPLADGGETPTMSASAASEAPAGDGAPVLPPWLDGIHDPRPPTPELGGEPPIPDWMALDEPRSTPGHNPIIEVKTSGVGAESSGSAESDAMPDWLGALVAEIGTPDDSATTAVESTPPEAESASTPIAATEAPAAEAPSWLQQEASVWPEAPATAPAAPEPPAAGPEPVRTDLPVWLKAMQKTPIAAPTDGNGIATGEEKVGPLAGVRGILPAEPIIAAPRLASNVPGLLVTEEQMAQAELLQSILTAAAEPLPEPTPVRRNWTALVERWAIAAALLVAIAIALVLRPNALPAPAPTAQTQSAFQVIKAVRPEAVALVAFDYDAASAGEMNPLAMALLRHLASRNVRVVAMSTRPTGPALAQMALDAVAAEGAHLKYGERAVNLGYLPGGPVGLSAFVLNPAILSSDYRDGSDPWTKPAANGLTSLGQAQGGLIVLAADATSLRDWVEQVGVTFPNLPIIAATSASGEPLARPYFEGGQVKGLIAGLPGADSYETLTGHPAAAADLREAQGFGQAIALFVLLIGALVALVQTMTNRSKA